MNGYIEIVLIILVTGIVIVGSIIAVLGLVSFIVDDYEKDRK